MIYNVIIIFLMVVFIVELIDYFSIFRIRTKRLTKEQQLEELLVPKIVKNKIKIKQGGKMSGLKLYDKNQKQVAVPLYNEDDIIGIIENRINELEEWLENPLDVPDEGELIQREFDRLEHTLQFMKDQHDVLYELTQYRG